MDLRTRIRAEIESTIKNMIRKEVENVLAGGSSTLTETKKRHRRPSKAVIYGVEIGQQWVGKQKTNQGRLVEIVSLGKDAVQPKVLKGKNSSKRIKYENLKSCYKLV